MTLRKLVAEGGNLFIEDREVHMFKKSLQHGLCLVLAVLVGLAPVSEYVLAAEDTWDEFGIAPFASSFPDACVKAPAAIDGMSLSQEDKDAFKLKLGPNCAGGTEEWITPDTVFTNMWSGGRNPHVINDFQVARLYVAQSPSGRPYPTESVAQTVRVLTWTIQTSEGEKKLVLPYVCFNWSLLILSSECVSVTFNARIRIDGVRVKNARWGIGTGASEPLAPSKCSAQKQGSGNWTAWWGECTYCQVATAYMEKLLGTRVQVFQKYLYPVTDEQQAHRFSREIRNSVVYFCLEYEDGTSSCGVYIRPEDWEGRTTINIPDEMFIVGNCPE